MAKKISVSKKTATPSPKATEPSPPAVSAREAQLAASAPLLATMAPLPTVTESVLTSPGQEIMPVPSPASEPEATPKAKPAAVKQVLASLQPAAAPDHPADLPTDESSPPAMPPAHPPAVSPPAPPRAEPAPQEAQPEVALPSSQPEPTSQAHRGPSLYVVHITPELAPVAKVGGLGDVVFGLSRELAIRGNHVEIILPRYDNLRLDHIFELHVAVQDLWVPWNEAAIHCTVYFGYVHDRKCFFIEPHSQDNFFNRGAIYGPRGGGQGGRGADPWAAPYRQSRPRAIRADHLKMLYHNALPP